MVGIKFGSTPIIDIRLGNTPINEVRRGSVLVWQRSSTFDDFNRDDADDLGANWTFDASTYKIGVENNAARVKIPEGLVGSFYAINTSRARFNAGTADADDGWIECQPSSLGSSHSVASPSGYKTQVFGRGKNTDTTCGIGMTLQAGHLFLTKRIDSVDSHLDAGTFQPGDILRMGYTGYGFVLLNNGDIAASLEDPSHTTYKGDGYRSLILRGDGAKDFLGPRRFSPALDYVSMG